MVFTFSFLLCGKESFFIERVKGLEKRIGVVGIVLDTPEVSAGEVNSILSDFAELIIGRMGIPYKERGVSVISLIVDGTNDEIGAMTGRIGQLPDVSVKAILTRV